jgi:uncharacterized protein YcbX
MPVKIGRLPTMTTARITALYRYPMKGFSPEPLERAEIEAGGTMPFDRAFAIENGASGFDPAEPAYFPKAYFLMLMKNERIAEFRSRFEEQSGIFSIYKDGRLKVDGSLRTADGRARLEEWLAENFDDELRGPPRILSAPGHSFSDVSAKVVHVVNLASVRALEAKLDRPVDPLRFRPNIVIDGPPAFAELGWEGRGIQLPGLRLVGKSRTGRCAATNVDPKTGRRDMEIPRTLESLYGHADFGIYLAAASKGTLAVGDAFEVLPTAETGAPV